MKNILRRLKRRKKEGDHDREINAVKQELQRLELKVNVYEQRRRRRHSQDQQ
jgi:hypothetical protein